MKKTTYERIQTWVYKVTSSKMVVTNIYFGQVLRDDKIDKVGTTSTNQHSIFFSHPIDSYPSYKHRYLQSTKILLMLQNAKLFFWCTLNCYLFPKLR